ncbi:unnamed protein product [Penicillium palitans]
MSLDALPFEVICLVTSYLPENRDRLSLLRCNRVLHDTVIDVLYKQDELTTQYALRWLVERGFERRTQYLISRNNLDVNIPLSSRTKVVNTPLLIAIGSGRANMVELLLRILLQHGAHVDLVGVMCGLSPLGCALEFGNPSQEGNPYLWVRRALYGDFSKLKEESEFVAVIQLLLANGADPHFQSDKNLSTALHRIPKGPWKSPGKLFSLFVDYGAVLNAQDSKGDTPLHVAFSHGAFLGDMKAQKEFVTLLLGSGADVNAQNLKGDTPLHVAFSHGAFLGDMKAQKEFVTLLLGSGADVNAQNSKGDTLLHVAFSHGAFLGDMKAQKEFVTLLLGSGADVNAQNSKGDTPLHVAFYHNAFPGDMKAQKELVTLLLRSGADVNLQNRREETPLGISVENPGILELLIKPVAGTRWRGKSGGEIISKLLKTPWRKQKKGAKQYVINTILIELLLEHGACADQIIDRKCPLDLPAAARYPVLKDLMSKREMAAPKKSSRALKNSGATSKVTNYKKPTKTRPRKKATK